MGRSTAAAILVVADVVFPVHHSHGGSRRQMLRAGAWEHQNVHCRNPFASRNCPECDLIARNYRASCGLGKPETERKSTAERRGRLETPGARAGSI